MSAVTPIRLEEMGFAAVSSAGEHVKIPSELFKLLKEWAQEKRAGSVVLNFNNGGIAGIEANIRIK